MTLRYTLGLPTPLENIFSYSLPKNSSLPCLDNIYFNHVDLHSSIAKKKSVDDFIELKLQDLNEHGLNICLSIYQIKSEDVASVKKLMNKTKKSWLSGHYSDYDMDTHIVALKILTNKNALLICLDCENEGIEAENLVGDPYFVHAFLENHSIYPINWNWGFFHPAQESFLSSVENLEEYPGSNFKKILEQQILSDEITYQKKKLEKSISKKNKGLEFKPLNKI